MTKRLSFSIEVEVDDNVDEARAKEVLEELLSEAEDDDMYDSIIVIEDLVEVDDTVYEVLDMLDVMSDDQVDHAIDAVRRLSDDE